MKTQKTLLALAILITSLMFGQTNTFPPTGNAGIGTTSPTNALTVQKVSGGVGFSGTDGTGGVRVNCPSGYVVALDAWDGNEPRWGITSFSGNTPTVILEGKYNSKDAYFNSGGNVGIGTTSPTAKLEVNGNLQLTNDGNSIQFKNDAVQISRVIYQDAMKLDSYGGFQFYDSSSGFERFRILTGGNVGIGTTIPDEKLTLNGTIHATEVKVTQTVPADYVFQKYYTGKSELKSDYVMPTLAEIENFTMKNHHLPNVPSAQEIKQNGLSLGEMSNMLLQKLEELTLYAIEQNKELERLKKENEQYKSLAERVEALEKK